MVELTDFQVIMISIASFSAGLGVGYKIAEKKPEIKVTKERSSCPHIKRFEKTFEDRMTKIYTDGKISGIACSYDNGGGECSLIKKPCIYLS